MRAYVHASANEGLKLRTLLGFADASTSLSILVLGPLAVGLLSIPIRSESLVKKISLLAALATLGLSVYVFLHAGEVRESYDWIPSMGIRFTLDADGLSASMLVLTALLTVVAMGVSWSSIHSRAREFFILLLVLETGMLGVFAAFDLFLFYLFWELTLIPMVFIIGLWGGPRRVYSAVKFLIYTMGGSLFMLAAIIFVAIKTQSFDYYLVRDYLRIAGLPEETMRLLFLAFTISFAVKVPMFPLHTWLPDAHVEAPTAGSVILAGVLLKMGGYGLARFSIPFFPQAAHHYAGLMMVLGVVGIVFGAFMAMTQGDIKRLIAYSSVSHMGFVVFGLFSFKHNAVQGALLEMVNHGLSTGALFMLVGMIYDRTHRRGVEDFGGLASKMPVFAAAFMIATLSSIGLPGLNGFVGELLILLGGYAADPLLTAVAGSGVILGAVYMLRLYRNVFFGEVRAGYLDSVQDLTAAEKLSLAPIVALIFALGVVPWVVLARTARAAESVIGAAIR
jgi:NADH-quinone oxidoreductase subunit M